jgi:DNA-binding transcriptional regulator LsrR (DeoR family)
MATDELASHPDLARIIDVVRMHYHEKRSQDDIARDLRVSPATVSRWLKVARDEELFELQIVFPTLTRTQDELKKAFDAANEKLVAHVVPASTVDRKNVANIAQAVAERLIEAIREIPKEDVRICLSCGETLREVVRQFIAKLNGHRDLRQAVRTKVLTFYPTTLYDDYDISPIFPHTLVVDTVLRAREAFGTELRINAMATTLPRGFYHLSPRERASYKKRYGQGIATIVDAAWNADIFVIGIGVTKDDNYEKVLGRIRDKKLPHGYETEACYIPVDKHGETFKPVEDNLEGLTIRRLRELAKREDRHVIAHAGGLRKAGIVNPFLDNPFFSYLVTDTDVANAWLAQRTK